MLLFFLLSFPPQYYLTLLLWDELLVRYVLIFWILLALSLLFARYLDHRSPQSIGYMLHPRWLKEYSQGVLLGLVLVFLLFIIELGSGSIRVTLNQLSPSLLARIFIPALLMRVFQSASEELLFRGYLFQNFITGTSPLVATVVMSSLFGVGHLLTPQARGIVALNLTAFGAMHALAYLRTRSLWLPSGLHFGWNFFLGRVFSRPVSGTLSSETIFLVRTTGPGWLTGGDYGPEAGIPALLLITVACFLICFWRGIRIAPEMADLLRKTGHSRLAKMILPPGNFSQPA